VLVALGNQASGRRYSEAEKEFGRRVGYLGNGLRVITPNGTQMKGDFASLAGMWAKKPLKERQQLDNLGRHDPTVNAPPPPKNGLVLKVYRRALDADEKGWHRPSKVISKEGVSLSSEPQLDHVWLKLPEWQSLVPSSPRVRQVIHVAPTITDRLCRFYLIDATTGITEQWYWNAKSVVEQRLRLTVAQVTTDRIEMDLEGAATYSQEKVLPRRISYRLGGKLTYDRTRKQFTRFDVTAVSREGHLELPTKKRRALGVAFELTTAEKAGDRIPPFFVNEPGYWGTR
jgi:hypothetical protein